MINIEQLASQYIFGSEMSTGYQKYIDFSHSKISEVSTAIFDSCFGPQTENINTLIARFYMLNEAINLLRHQHHDLLPKESAILFERYEQEMNSSSKLIFTYLVLACAMEARHCDQISTNKQWEDFMEKETEEFYENNAYRLYHITDPKELEQAQNQLYAQAEEHAAKAFEQYREGHIAHINFQRHDDRNLKLVYSILESIGEVENYETYHVEEKLLPQFTQVANDSLTIGQFIEELIKIFDYGDFDDGYGGEAWGKIAQHTLDFAQGKISAEIFIDQALSLEHNSGQVFNKNMIFYEPGSIYLHSLDMDSERIKEHMIKTSTLLLNMQHEGQLLSFLNTDMGLFAHELKRFEKNITAESRTVHHYKLMDHLREIFPFYRDKSEELIYNAICTTQINLEHFDFHFYQDFQEDPVLKQIKQDILNLGIEPKNFNLTALMTQSDFEYNECYMTKGVNAFFALHDRICSPQGLDLIEQTKEFHFEWLDTAHIPTEKKNKTFLGNKALGLSVMQEAGLPVPKALVLPTPNVHSFFLHQAQWKEKMQNEVTQMLNQFDNMMLVSVRSGAALSMPGMMDTILNVGIDDSNYDALCEKIGKQVVDDCVVKFIRLFSNSYLNGDGHYWDGIDKSLVSFKRTLIHYGIDVDTQSRFPLNRETQVRLCIEAVFNSWNSERAVAYRTHHNISENLGTAVIIQQMVFGNKNMDSATGVVFSRNCVTGEKEMVGEYLPMAQGEDIVAGTLTPYKLETMKERYPECYKELQEICEKLERQHNAVQDIEFTIEDKKLYILQHRAAVCSTQAKAYLDMEQYRHGLINKETLIDRMSIDILQAKTQVIHQGQTPQAQGLIGNTGVVRGIIIHRAEDMKEYQNLYNEMKAQYTDFGWILHACHTSPELTPLMLKTKGFITDNGGFTSHAAILARAWNKPCVVGIGNKAAEHLRPGVIVTLDANEGNVYTDILPLSENSEQVKMSTQMVLEHFGVQEQELKDFSNQQMYQKTWMEELIPNTPIKIEKFISLGQKAAMILLKHQQEKKPKP